MPPIKRRKRLPARCRRALRVITSYSIHYTKLYEQLRISSIDAIEIDDALFEVMAEPRLAPFMHLSLQHGDNLILKRMKRRHSRDDAIALAENRITSYNVCYTKLLRTQDRIKGLPQHLTGHDGVSVEIGDIQRFGAAFGKFIA